jgi:hypothetical protein
MIPVEQRPTVVSLLREVGPVEFPPAASDEWLYRTTARREAGSMGYSTTEPSVADGDKVELPEISKAAGVVESGQKGIALGTAGGDSLLRTASARLDSTLIAGTTQESERVDNFAFLGLPKDFDSSEWIILTVLLPQEEESR